MGTETFKGLDNRCLVLEDQVLPTTPPPHENTLWMCSV